MQLRPHQQRAFDAMQQHNAGQIIVPTGGGKTYIMIADTLARAAQGSTTVVVAPRILLAEQLCKEFLELVDTTYTHVMHVHSGETHHFSSTKPAQIHLFANTARTAGENVIIFTTYHSLHRIQEADIEVNTIYFDEAHNSVQRNFFPATEHFSADADRCYFFTATPKHSLTIFKPGMNDTAVYGNVICHVPAPQLVAEGYILPPKVVVKTLPPGDFNLSDSENLLQTLDEQSVTNVLVAASSTKQIARLGGESAFCTKLTQRGTTTM